MAKLDLPKGYLSPSAVTAYLKCPHSYYLKYILGVRERTKSWLIEGSCHHDALEESNKRFIQKGDFPPERELTECFADTYADKSKEIDDWQEGEKPDHVITRGKATLERYHRSFQRTLRPVRSEQEYTFELDGVPVLLYTDVEEDDGLTDYKVTVSRPKSDRDARDDLQLTLQSIASGKRKVRFCSLVPSGRKVQATKDTERSYSELTHAAEIVKSVAEAISRGSFPKCDPKNFLCSAKYCGFWTRCRGNPSPKRFQVVELDGDEWTHWRRTGTPSAKPARSPRKPVRSASRREVRRSPRSSSSAKRRESKKTGGGRRSSARRGSS